MTFRITVHKCLACAGDGEVGHPSDPIICPACQGDGCIPSLVRSHA